MIFVTVGTHEQGFTRLIKSVDELAESGAIHEPVMMQIGYTEYTPRYCKYERFLGYEQMMQYEETADVVITHGGPSTFMSVLSKGKVPVVVPRQHQFHEHVNDHQLLFSQEVLQRGYPILVVKDISELLSAIKQAKRTVRVKSHNREFVQHFTKIVQQLVNRKR